MPIDLTGIQNVGEFYSHHYLDSLLEGDLKGLFAKWTSQEKEESADRTPDRLLEGCATRFFAAKSNAARQRKAADRYAISHPLHVQILEALGYSYDPTVHYSREDDPIPLLGEAQRDGNPYLWIVETPFTTNDDPALDQPLIPDQFPSTFWNEDVSSSQNRDPSLRSSSQDDIEQTSRIQSTLVWEELIAEIFRIDQPPRWVLMLAGRYLYLMERAKWGQGQYLLFDLDEIFGRRERTTLRATAALLSKDALCPDEGVPIHDTLDENSHKHAYAVSEDLKFGVRRAVALLANEYVYYQRTVAKQRLYDETRADDLTKETLTWLYRLLFLFYVEARGAELAFVPMKSEAYRTGYSLETLRDLEQVPLTTPEAQNGYFFHESLRQLFRLVDQGFDPSAGRNIAMNLRMQDENGRDESEREGTHEDNDAADPSIDRYGFRMTGLHSSLFNEKSTPLLSSVKFRNAVLQEIIQSLSLSKEGGSGKKGKRGKKNQQRGRISYAQLGINQLGAVYEGLLSYSGFFAQETLYEVKPAGKDPAKEDVQDLLCAPEPARPLRGRRICL